MLSGGSELPKISASPRSSGVGSEEAGTKSFNSMFDFNVMIGIMKDSFAALPSEVETYKVPGLEVD